MKQSYFITLTKLETLEESFQNFKALSHVVSSAPPTASVQILFWKKYETLNILVTLCTGTPVHRYTGTLLSWHPSRKERYYMI